MSERFLVTYLVGGKISEADISLLVDAITEEGLSTAWDAGGSDDADNIRLTIRECLAKKKPLSLMAAELNWGNTIVMDAFCIEHGLQFLKRVEAKYEYNGEIIWWTPGMAEPKVWAATNVSASRPYASLEFLRKEEENHETLAQVIKILEAVGPTPPPLQLIA